MSDMSDYFHEHCTGARLTKACDVTIQRYRNYHVKIEDNKMHILRCMRSKFCVKFQRCPLKFQAFTQYFEPVHSKICVLWGVKIWQLVISYDILSRSETGPWTAKRSCEPVNWRFCCFRSGYKRELYDCQSFTNVWRCIYISHFGEQFFVHNFTIHYLLRHAGCLGGEYFNIHLSLPKTGYPSQTAAEGDCVYR